MSIPTGVRLRAAAPTDARAGATMHAACWREAYGPLAVRPDAACSLWVLDGNERAQTFYRRQGFVADGAREHDPGLDAWEIRMVRP